MDIEQMGQAGNESMKSPRYGGFTYAMRGSVVQPIAPPEPLAQTTAS